MQDGKEWVECEKCFKWTHTDCERANNGNFDENTEYYCLTCRKKCTKTAQHQADTPSIQEDVGSGSETGSKEDAPNDEVNCLEGRIPSSESLFEI
jgi:hypothetical protein